MPETKKKKNVELVLSHNLTKSILLHTHTKRYPSSKLQKFNFLEKNNVSSQGQVIFHL